MSDYIERDKIMNFCNVVINRQGNEEEMNVVVESFKAFAEYVKALPSAQPEQRWIPCDKGEPDEDMECWVTVKTTDALYRGNFTKRFGKGFVTSCGFMWWNTALAWMPIYEPEPYRTEGDDNHEG